MRKDEPCKPVSCSDRESRARLRAGNLAGVRGSHEAIYPWFRSDMRIVPSFRLQALRAVLSCIALAATAGAFAAHPSQARPGEAIALTPPPLGEPGRAAGSPLSVSHLRVEFEDTASGALSEVRTVFISNTAQRPVQGIAIELDAAPGVFRMYANCPAALAPGASCAVMLRFAPTQPGAQLGLLRVTEPSSSLAIELQGTGTEAPPPFGSSR